ncbi:MAG: hypothetical protein ACJ796_10415 [Gemmatimonadaceae bacterium]
MSGLSSRQMLETGQLPMVAIVQRESGAWDEVMQKRIEALKAARSRHAALSDAIERDIGEVVNEISVKGRDTLEVAFWIPGSGGKMNSRGAFRRSRCRWFVRRRNAPSGRRR